MRGTSFILVLVMISSTVPLISIETRISSLTSSAQTRLIENQRDLNVQDDILRTFMEAVGSCDDESCISNFNAWKSYWESRGFKVVSGKLRVVNDVIMVDPSPLIIDNGVLRPGRNQTDFGIVVKGNTTEVVINQGDWGAWADKS